MSTIDRPEVAFDAPSHTYKVEGQDVLGVSTIAKIGGAEDSYSIGSAWGFRLGYEGAHALATEHDALVPFDVVVQTKDGPKVVRVKSQDDLREAMKGRGLTPWATRDRAADRGSWVHDVLEELGQSGTVPDLDKLEAAHGHEARKHAESLLRWFLVFRPSFVALEVQVASREHGFAGRYDVRAKVEARRIIEAGCIHPLREDPQAVRVRELAERGEWALGLIDLKTSKGVYPTTHFPQLEGYEGGGVEMGFPATDFRAVVNTNGDGTFDPATGFAVSWSTYEHFVSFLGALRSIRAIKAGDPEVILERKRQAVLLAHLPAASRQLVEMNLPELAGLTSREVGGLLGKMRKRGKVEQGADGRTWQLVERS